MTPFNICIPSYNLTDRLYEGIKTDIYRGQQTNTDTPVIIKVLKEDYPTIEAITSLKHEYNIVKDLNHENVIKVQNLESHHKCLAIVFEDFDGVSLKQYIKSTKISITITLIIAIAITKALDYIHQQRIIHKDIKPANIIINPKTLETKLIDFGIASKLSKETTQLVNLNQLEGTLAYMSPEQTGRMNRIVDYRSDFYSFGITLYEMLIGCLPFTKNDALELVYAHLTQVAIPIQSLNANVPSTLAAIVTKLIAKNAEDRYQSAKGLLVDLEECLSQMETTGKIVDFIPGQLDVLSQLLPSQKLYGREEEIKSLVFAFEQVSLGYTELLLVSGYSGIGKTSFINEVQKPITKARGYFTSGKFDQFKRDIPYTSLIQAFSSLMQQILAESTQQLDNWKAKIIDAVDSNGQVIIDVIPEVELIIGKQPIIAQLEPKEAQTRFQRVFIKFIEVFARQEHPLVIFLDDLQWVDSATLKLMQLLVTDTDIQYLLLIGAYRDSEVSPTHSLINTIEQIEKTSTVVKNIVLKPLSKDNVALLLADTLRETRKQTNFKIEFSEQYQSSKAEEILHDIVTSQDIYSLAEFIFNKTGGNPFFITQLLQALYQESLLKFDFNLKKWQWNLDKIKSVDIIDKDVVELVVSRIQELPITTKEVLKLAACIGDSFTLDILCIISEKHASLVASELYPALQAGFILSLNDSYCNPSLFENNQENLFNSKAIEYKFIHDRFKEAAYSLIPNIEKQETHLKIGKLLKMSTPQEFLLENILEIVNHFNTSIDLIDNQEEKYELAKLNLLAGNKAKYNAAFGAANKYFNIGLELLTKDSWNTNYELTLSLHIEASESLYLTSHFDSSKKLASLTLKKTISILDKIRVSEILIRSYTAQNKFCEAVDIGLEVLKALDISLPNKPNYLHVLNAFIQTKLILFGKKIDDLENLPQMTKPNILAAIQILMLLSPIVSMAGSLHFPLIILAMVRLSVRHGTSRITTFAYSTYGAIICDKFGDIEAGYQFGKLGIKLLEKVNSISPKCNTYFLFNTMIRHFKEPVVSTIQPLIEGIQTGLETGDIEFASYSIWNLSQILLLSGNNLEIQQATIAKYVKLVKKSKFENVALFVNGIQQIILNLQELSAEKTLLKGDNFNEAESMPFLIKNPGFLSQFFACKSMLQFLLSDYKGVINNIKFIEQQRSTLVGFLCFSVNNFYYSLSLLALYSTLSISKQKKYLHQVKINQSQMRKWAFNAPCNYQHKYELVEAEKARVLGQESKAMHLYEKAIAGASLNGYIQEFSLANELAAKFYLALGRENIAKIYMTEAHYSYTRWGAIAKVQDLEECYPHLLPRTSQPVSLSTSLSTNSTCTKSLSLDISTVVKASQALSSEIVVERLLEKLLHLVKENAGAQKVFFIVKKDQELVIEASLTEENNFIISQSQSINKHHILPVSLINYIERTKTSLVLDNATNDNNFYKDSYIIANQPKSILASPIIYQNKLLGILYLENNLTTNAFTQDRLEVLQILSAQAAISLENTRFYSTLEESVQERTYQLEEKNQQLQETLQELQRTQSQLIHSEKMSSLGQLVAGIAHEINNPINFIYGNLTHTSNYAQSILEMLDIYQIEYQNTTSNILEKADEIDLDFIREDMPKLLNSMRVGASRVRDIVQSLRIFSRLDEAPIKNVNIHDNLDSTLMILQKKLEKIIILKNYGNLPEVYCYAGELNQVFLHLLTNAIDALLVENNTGQELEKVPTISISTALKLQNQVLICIADNGVGMDNTTKSKIFDPFFTTKPVGKGTGLGLSISYQIVTQKHGGTIECISSPGAGTEFLINIPLKLSSTKLTEH